MNHADTTLANLMREQLTRAIELATAGLIKDPNQRTAGQIEGMQNALAMVDGTYAKLNDIRPNQKPET